MVPRTQGSASTLGPRAARRDALRAALAGSAALALPGAARAQAYPNRPIRILVGTAPGGPSDFLARLLAERVTAALGQSVVVENRPGASGTIATEQVARSAADGYTLTVGGPAAMISPPYLMAKVGYDPMKDFVPIAMLGAGAFVLAVHPSVPATNVRELIALARARPGEITFGSGGNGASGHLLTESFASAAGIRLLHVPYKGEGPAVTDLVGGQLQMMFSAPSALMPHVRSGKLRGLAVTTRERVASYAELPSVHESGVPDFEYLGWIIAFAPAGTPREVIDLLASTWRRAREQPEVRERLEKLGMLGPEKLVAGDALRAFVTGEDRRTAQLIRTLGIQPQ